MCCWRMKGINAALYKRKTSKGAVPGPRYGGGKGVISCLGYLDDDEPNKLEEDAEICVRVLLSRSERESASVLSESGQEF